MKKILFIHQSSSVGGASYCLINIIKEIDRKEFEPIVAIRFRGPLETEVEALGAKVILFPEMMDIPYNQTLWDIRNIKRYITVEKSKKYLDAIIRKHSIDIVYINSMMLYRYLPTAKMAGAKTIIHLREHWPLQEHKLQLKAAQNTIEKYADQVVAINHYSAGMAKYSAYKTTVVYDWIDMSDRFENLPFNTYLDEDSTNLRVFLYTGGSDYMKGAYEIASSFTKVIKDPDCRLLFLGFKKPVTSGVKFQIKRLLTKMGYFDYSLSLNRALSADNRIICKPSLFKLKHIIEQSEGFISYFTVPHANLALAENITMGKPCIAARTEESEEYTFNGKFALLVEPNNITAFESALLDFVQNTENYRNMSADGSQIVSELFSKEKNSKLINQVIKRL